jgi:hypothetical protein
MLLLMRRRWNLELGLGRPVDTALVHVLPPSVDTLL